MEGADNAILIDLSNDSLLRHTSVPLLPLPTTDCLLGEIANYDDNPFDSAMYQVMTSDNDPFETVSKEAFNTTNKGHITNNIYSDSFVETGMLVEIADQYQVSKEISLGNATKKNEIIEEMGIRIDSNNINGKTENCLAEKNVMNHSYMDVPSITKKKVNLLTDIKDINSVNISKIVGDVKNTYNCSEDSKITESDRSIFSPSAQQLNSKYSPERNFWYSSTPINSIPRCKRKFNELESSSCRKIPSDSNVTCPTLFVKNRVERFMAEAAKNIHSIKRQNSKDVSITFERRDKCRRSLDSQLSLYENPISCNGKEMRRQSLYERDLTENRIAYKEAKCYEKEMKYSFESFNKLSTSLTESSKITFLPYKVNVATNYPSSLEEKIHQNEARFISKILELERKPAEENNLANESIVNFVDSDVEEEKNEVEKSFCRKRIKISKTDIEETTTNNDKIEVAERVIPNRQNKSSQNVQIPSLKAIKTEHVATKSSPSIHKASVNKKQLPSRRDVRKQPIFDGKADKMKIPSQRSSKTGSRSACNAAKSKIPNSSNLKEKKAISCSTSTPVQQKLQTKYAGSVKKSKGH